MLFRYLNLFEQFFNLYEKVKNSSKVMKRYNCGQNPRFRFVVCSMLRARLRSMDEEGHLIPPYTPGQIKSTWARSPSRQQVRSVPYVAKMESEMVLLRGNKHLHLQLTSVSMQEQPRFILLLSCVNWGMG